MSKNQTFLESIRSCRECEQFLPLAPKPILQFNSAASLLIVGQAPGRRTHENGKPFDDPSGVRLRQWLAMSESEFYNAQRVAILPMGFCYPGTGASGDLPPRKECLQWRQPLMENLPNIELTLLLGQYAQRYYYPDHKSSLTELVKRTDPQRHIVLALPHPSPRNNRWLKQQPWFEAEFIPRLRSRLKSIWEQPLSFK